jgi:flavin-dependent dehydrogenase
MFSNFFRNSTDGGSVALCLFKYSLNMTSGKKTQVLILGGGIAGLTLALLLAKKGIGVTVLEQHDYPRHKVCGEYVSMEVLPFLTSLGIDLPEHVFPYIKELWLSAGSGKSVHTPLSMGGIGISRYALDHKLFLEAKAQGAHMYTQSQAAKVISEANGYVVTTRDGQMFSADMVVCAHGKHGSPDRFLNRDIDKSKAIYTGLKWHFEGPWDKNVVALHNFPGGYAGISAVEKEKVNVCCLIQTSLLREVGNPTEAFEVVLSKNPHIREFMAHATPSWPEPLAIAAVNFAHRQPVEQGVAMLGDAAGLIAPLSGNGMARAFVSARRMYSAIEAESFDFTRQAAMLKRYDKASKGIPALQLRVGRSFQSLFGKGMVSETALFALKLFPFFLPFLIKQTHGRTLTPLA